MCSLHQGGTAATRAGTQHRRRRVGRLRITTARARAIARLLRGVLARLRCKDNVVLPGQFEFFDVSRNLSQCMVAYLGNVW